MSQSTDEAISAGCAPVQDDAQELYAAEQARMAEDARAAERLDGVFRELDSALSRYGELFHVADRDGYGYARAAKQAARVAYLADMMHELTLQQLGREVVRNA